MPTKFTLLEPSLEMLKKMVRLATVQFCLHEMDGVEKDRECTHRDGNGTPPYLDYKCGLRNCSYRRRGKEDDLTPRTI